MNVKKEGVKDKRAYFFGEAGALMEIDGKKPEYFLKLGAFGSKSRHIVENKGIDFVPRCVAGQSPKDIAQFVYNQILCLFDKLDEQNLQLAVRGVIVDSTGLHTK